MTVLVTGAAGYLGRRLLDRFSSDGIAAAGLVRSAPPADRGDIVIHQGDLTDAEAVDRAFAALKPDMVVHAAAYIPRGKDTNVADRSNADNVKATMRLLDAAARHGVRAIVNLSSIAVYGESPLYRDEDFREDEPTEADSIYGRDKLQAERLCREWSTETGHPALSLRLAGLHGDGRQSGVVFNFVRAALTGAPLTVASPDTRIAPLHVDDAVDAVRAALTKLSSATFRQAEVPPALNLGASQDISLLELAQQVSTVCGREATIEAGNAPPTRRVLSVDLARKTLGFDPTPLQDWLPREADLLKETVGAP